MAIFGPILTQFRSKQLSLKMCVFSLKLDKNTGVFNLPKAKKYDYFRENNCETRKGTPVVFSINTEIIAY